MELDPHTLQEILERIHQQMRCPQCGKRVPVDFSSVQVVADTSMLLQLKCEGCNAYIVLQASLKGVENLGASGYNKDETMNISSTLQLSKDEMGAMRQGLEECGGSFEKLFEKYGIGEDVNEEVTEQ